MPLIDYIIYILGIYGLSWIITQSNLFYNIRTYIESFNFEFINDLISCIVCTSVWLSIFFVWFYFPNEIWFTKLLIVGSTTTTTWGLAQVLNDVED